MIKSRRRAKDEYGFTNILCRLENLNIRRCRIEWRLQLVIQGV